MDWRRLCETEGTRFTLDITYKHPCVSATVNPTLVRIDHFSRAGQEWRVKFAPVRNSIGGNVIPQACAVFAHNLLQADGVSTALATWEVATHD
jgi:hypothetical protein